MITSLNRFQPKLKHSLNQNKFKSIHECGLSHLIWVNNDLICNECGTVITSNIISTDLYNNTRSESKDQKNNVSVNNAYSIDSNQSELYDLNGKPYTFTILSDVFKYDYKFKRYNYHQNCMIRKILLKKERKNFPHYIFNEIYSRYTELFVPYYFNCYFNAYSLFQLGFKEYVFARDLIKFAAACVYVCSKNFLPFSSLLLIKKICKQLIEERKSFNMFQTDSNYKNEYQIGVSLENNNGNLFFLLNESKSIAELKGKLRQSNIKFNQTHEIKFKFGSYFTHIKNIIQQSSSLQFNISFNIEKSIDSIMQYQHIFHNRKNKLSQLSSSQLGIIKKIMIDVYNQILSKYSFNSESILLCVLFKLILYCIYDDKFEINYNNHMIYQTFDIYIKKLYKIFGIILLTSSREISLKKQQIYNPNKQFHGIYLLNPNYNTKKLFLIIKNHI